MKLKIPGLIAYIGGLLVALVLVFYGAAFLIQYVPLFIQYLSSGSVTPETVISQIFFMSAFLLLAIEGLTHLPIAIKGLKASLITGDNDKIVKGTAKLFFVTGIFGLLLVFVVAAMYYFETGIFFISSWTDLVFSGVIIVLYIIGLIFYRGDLRVVSIVLFSVAPVVQLVKLIMGGLTTGVDTLTNVMNILRFVSFAILSGGTILLYVFAIIHVIVDKKAQE